MKRRSFLKGIGLLTLSPLIANIERHKQAVEFITSNEIVKDIKDAMNAIRNATGSHHKSYSVCLSNGMKYEIE